MINRPAHDHYKPTLTPEYNALLAMRGLPPEADGWLPLMTDILCLPVAMLPAVQQVIRNAAWLRAKDPIGSVRENAVRHAKRTRKSDEQITT